MSESDSAVRKTKHGGMARLLIIISWRLLQWEKSILLEILMYGFIVNSRSHEGRNESNQHESEAGEPLHFSS